MTMTRDGSYDLASEGAMNRKREDMKKRVAMINEEPSDLFISIHLNAYPNVAIHGGQVFYQKQSDTSKNFADMIQKRMNVLNQTDKHTKPGDYYILNETKPMGVLVECGFLSNAEDEALLLNNDYRDKIAAAIADGALRYLSSAANG